MVVFFLVLLLVYLLLIHAPAKFIEKREEQKRQAQALVRKDGYVHVAEAEDERASMIVYAKIIVSHFQILCVLRFPFASSVRHCLTG